MILEGEDMSLFDRLLLVFTAGGCRPVTMVARRSRGGFLKGLEAPHLRWAVAVIGLLLFLLSLRLLFSVMRRPKGEN